METAQSENYLLDKIFDRNLDPERKRDMLDIVFMNYILPNISSFIEVKEETYIKYGRSGSNKTARWHDRRNNAFYLSLFSKGPWFLVIDPPNATEYGREPPPNRYYEIPNFAKSVNQVLLQERELFG